MGGGSDQEDVNNTWQGPSAASRFYSGYYIHNVLLISSYTLVHFWFLHYSDLSYSRLVARDDLVSRVRVYFVIRFCLVFNHHRSLITFPFHSISSTPFTTGTPSSQSSHRLRHREIRKASINGCLLVRHLYRRQGCHCPAQLLHRYQGLGLLHHIIHTYVLNCIAFHSSLLSSLTNNKYLMRSGSAGIPSTNVQGSLQTSGVHPCFLCRAG